MDELHDAGNPAVLYPHGGGPREDTGGALLNLMAFHNRVTHCRTSALFSALAAESYINEFLGVHFKGKDLEAVDRFTPVNKYVLGTRLALGKPMFRRGDEPMQTIAALFKLRDKLVHPKPGFGPAALSEKFGEFEAQFTPSAISNYIVMVAAAGKILVSRAYGPKEWDAYADVAWQGREVIWAYANRTAKVPTPDSEPEPTLWAQILEVVKWGEKEGEQP